MDPGAWRMCIKEEEEVEIRKGPWTLEEDTKLISYVREYGAARWRSLAKLAGLKRDGKSCRMRWLNYLRPDLKHGTITPEEDRLIIELHNKWGNRWSRIAEKLPGRTDSEIKNHWRSHIKKMSPELAQSYSWPPISQTPEEVKIVREDNESCSKKSLKDQHTIPTKECYGESNVPKTLNQLNCDACELDDCDRAFFTCEEINQELIKISSDMDPLSGILADEYTGSMDQHSPIRCCSSVADSPMNEFSDSKEFLWDYNYITLWNLDDDIQSIDN